MSTDSVPELLIHVGGPKTGTTAIQRYMYRSREAYARQGIYWVETYPGLKSPDHPDSWAHHVYSHKWGGWLNSSEFEVTPDEAWRALQEFIQTKGGRHIISSERFTDILPGPIGDDVINFIKEMAGAARVKVIGYVRRQDDLIESFFRQQIKVGLLTGRDRPSIDAYMQNLPACAFFDETFSRAADLLGKENVIVRIYDSDRLVGGDSVSDFLYACDLPALGSVERLVEPINPSLNTLTSKLLSDPRIVNGFAGQIGSARFIRDFFNQDHFSRLNKRVLFDSNMRREIMDSFAAGNDHLANMFLSADDTDVLAFHADTSKVAISDDELILTYGELAKLLANLAGSRDKPFDGRPIEEAARMDRRKSHSIEAEDLLLANAWVRLLKRSVSDAGTYLDLGASHPVDHSNTYYFYERGWSGICVEANPELCSLYSTARPRDVVHNIGIASEPGSLTYHRFKQYLINGFMSQKIVDEHIGRGQVYLGNKDIECVAIADFLRHDVEISVDILNIDVETMESSIIRAWDWEICRPKLICVEIHSRDVRHMLNSGVCKLLEGSGYVPVSRGLISTIFVDSAYLN